MTDIAERAAKGGKARAAKLTPEQRSEAARRAVCARWARHRAAHATRTLRTWTGHGGAVVSVTIAWQAPHKA